MKGKGGWEVLKSALLGVVLIVCAILLIEISVYPSIAVGHSTADTRMDNSKITPITRDGQDSSIDRLVSDNRITDTDGDGLADGVEEQLGTDPTNPDTDGDGLSDGYEFYNTSTDPRTPDTDEDGLTDGYNLTSLSSVSWKYVKASDYDGLIKINGHYVGEKSVGTYAFIKDTDGDGIWDGYEVQNLSRMSIPTKKWGGILHSYDYDHDNLPDGFEIRMFYFYYENSSKSKLGGFLNVTNSSDAYADFDSDGLTNLQEYNSDPGGDFDKDKTPDIYDSDDDNDGIPTAVEVANGLNPFGSFDAQGDKDGDGLTNLFEYENKLNISNADTDNDTVNDLVEYYLQNSTGIFRFYNCTQFLGSRMSLWKQYMWAIAYYFSLRDGKGFDDVYRNLNLNSSYYLGYYMNMTSTESNILEADNYLKKQFNPWIKEDVPPIILDVKFSIEGRSLYYNFTIADVSGFDKIIIKDLNSGDSKVLYGKEEMCTFTGTLNSSKGSDRIEIVAYDRNGNVMEEAYTVSTWLLSTTLIIIIAVVLTAIIAVFGTLKRYKYHKKKVSEKSKKQNSKKTAKKNNK